MLNGRRYPRVAPVAGVNADQGYADLNMPMYTARDFTSHFFFAL